MGESGKERMREMCYKKREKNVGKYRVKAKEKYCTVCVIKKEREMVGERGKRKGRNVL